MRLPQHKKYYPELGKISSLKHFRKITKSEENKMNRKNTNTIISQDDIVLYKIKVKIKN